MFKKLLVGFSFLLAFLFIGFSVNSKSVGNSTAKTAENDVLSQQASKQALFLLINRTTNWLVLAGSLAW